MKFGLRIPSFAWPRLTYAEAQGLREYSQRVEALGFDAVWVIEHLLVAPLIYGVSWLDPLVVLSFVAGGTRTIKIGTGILVLPLRNPVILAKEIATLDSVSGGRFILGIGLGWDPKEFEAVGIPIRERAARTDEALELLRRLLTEPHVTFKGRFYACDDVTIDPRPARMLPIWMAGGSANRAPGVADSPVMAPGVLRRLVKADGWICRSGGSDLEAVKRDWADLQAYARSVGRDPGSITFAHAQFVHIVETTDRDKALDIQVPLFQRVMGHHRDRATLVDSYLIGTIDDMHARISELQSCGLQYLILNPVTDDPRQLELIHRYLVAGAGGETGAVAGPAGR